MATKLPVPRMTPKVCPWCQEEPDIFKSPLWAGTHGYKGAYKFNVGCRNPKCPVRPETKGYDTVYGRPAQECIDKSIEDWNNRKE